MHAHKDLTGRGERDGNFLEGNGLRPTELMDPIGLHHVRHYLGLVRINRKRIAQSS
jgi:hypothetical protein